MFGFREIEVAALKSLAAGQEILLIDVRTEAEVARGMIDGARHLPLHLLPIKADELDPDVPIVFYCQSGARSAQACMYLAGRGFGNTYNLRGGILAWVRSGQTLQAVA